MDMVETRSFDSATVRAWFSENRTLHVAIIENGLEWTRISLRPGSARQLRQMLDAAVRALDDTEFNLRSFCVEQIFDRD